MHKIKTAMLAYGMSGKIFHAPFLSMHEGYELVAVLERNEKKAIHEIPGILSYSTLEELLSDDQIELVIVNTPNFTHFDFAAKALEAGKHVLLEKPFTVTSDEARQLFDMADKKKLHVLPFQNRRWDTDYLAVKNIAGSGKLGRLAEVHFRFDRYRLGIGNKKGKETNVPGSGILYDLGPHLLDAAISLFGRPHSWTKSLGRFRPATVVDDYAHIHLSYENDLQVFLTMSMIVPDPQPAFILHGTKGSFIKQRSDVQEMNLINGVKPDNLIYNKENPLNAGVLTLIDEPDRKLAETVPQSAGSYLSVFDAVHQTIVSNQPFPVTREQILLQLTILED